jgi:hypothetical protein
MTSCVYEGCNKPGMYQEGTLCRTHKNSVLIAKQEKNATLIPIYCNRCNDTTQTLNCQSGLYRCKNHPHRCTNCDDCNCGIEQITAERMSYYTKCGCFTSCPGCISTLKGYE